jgi:hypothetical protein
MLMFCHRMMGTSMAHDCDIDDRGKLLCRKEAARYLTALGLVIAPQTLARKYHDGTGPLCTHVGARAMYWQAHLDAYFKAQVSDAAAGSPRSKTRAKKSAADRAQSRKANMPAPSHEAPSDDATSLVIAPLPGPAVDSPSIAKAKPTKPKKRSNAAPLNQQELPF